MAFMEKQVTEKMTWYQVHTDDITRGIVSYPGSDFTLAEVAKLEGVDAEDIETIAGYGARMSAPGYLDCTEWSVCASPEEAEAELDLYYGDDDEEEEDDEEGE